MTLEFTMSITIMYTSLGRTCAAILRPESALDRSNYAELIVQALAARAAGACILIVDLRDVARVGSAGLVGLYAVTRLARGVPPPDPEAGWAAIRALAEEQPPLPRLAVLNPCPPLRQTLESAPFSDFLAIHADLDIALAALAARGRARQPLLNKGANPFHNH